MGDLTYSEGQSVRQDVEGLRSNQSQSQFYPLCPFLYVESIAIPVLLTFRNSQWRARAPPSIESRISDKTELTDNLPPCVNLRQGRIRTSHYMGTRNDFILKVATAILSLPGSMKKSYSQGTVE
jgi:hypothetical protein